MAIRIDVGARSAVIQGGGDPRVVLALIKAMRGIGLGVEVEVSTEEKEVEVSTEEKNPLVTRAIRRAFGGVTKLDPALRGRPVNSSERVLSGAGSARSRARRRTG